MPPERRCSSSYSFVRVNMETSWLIARCRRHNLTLSADGLDVISRMSASETLAQSCSSVLRHRTCEPGGNHDACAAKNLPHRADGAFAARHVRRGGERRAGAS